MVNEAVEFGDEERAGAGSWLTKSKSLFHNGARSMHSGRRGGRLVQEFVDVICDTRAAGDSADLFISAFCLADLFSGSCGLRALQHGHARRGAGRDGRFSRRHARSAKRDPRGASGSIDHARRQASCDASGAACRSASACAAAATARADRRMASRSGDGRDIQALAPTAFDLPPHGDLAAAAFQFPPPPDGDCSHRLGGAACDRRAGGGAS